MPHTRMAFISILFCSIAFYLSPGGNPVRAQIGNVTSVVSSGKTVTIRCDTMAVRFISYRTDVVRVDFLPSPRTVFDSSIVVIRDTSEGLPFHTSVNDSLVLVAAGSLRIVCTKSPFRIRFYDDQGRFLLSDWAEGGFDAFGRYRSVTFGLQSREHIYGGGEHGLALDRRGEYFDSYNTQAYGYSTPVRTMKINVPFIASTAGYALYFENTWPGRFDVGSSDPERFEYLAEGGEISYYFMVAPTLAKGLDVYTWLTGRQPLPPRWALGFLQSRFGYKNEEEARSTVTTLREHRIPCDALILDLYWFRMMGDLEWNRAAWPDPFRMIEDFLHQGIKTVVITEPYITVPSLLYNEAAAKGFLGKDITGQPYIMQNWWSCGCGTSLVDFTNPEAQTWWWSKHPGFFGSQLAGIWTDLGEPERHPDEMMHHGGPARKIHNIYNLLWAKTVAAGFSNMRPNQRLFNLTRSGYAGMQRYSAIPWSGDVAKTFSGLAAQPQLTLSMGLSGFGYYNSDIGGFTGSPTSPELYVRWMQYGVFCPITRAHGSGYPTEPWAFGAPAEANVKSYLELRYRLLPYNYTLAWENSQTGLPLMRPLFFEDPTDDALANVHTTYLWGDALLVSPVVEQGVSRQRVRFPQGTWIDFWTDEVVEGGRELWMPTQWETIPLYVRAGGIIPMAPPMQYSSERSLDTLFLALYPTPGPERAFTLYEDDGETQAYKTGGYALTEFRQAMQSASDTPTFTLTIGATRGDYTGKPPARTYVCDVHRIDGPPDEVLVNGTTLSRFPTLDSLRRAGNGYSFDPLARRLYVHLQTRPETSYVIRARGAMWTGIFEGGNGDARSTLSQNYPNPFNPRTEIKFRMGETGFARLVVYDLLGREVSTLINTQLAPGEYAIPFDATGLGSGIYFYRLHTGGLVQTKSMVLAR